MIYVSTVDNLVSRLYAVMKGCAGSVLAQIQPRKHVERSEDHATCAAVDCACYTGPIREHELDHTRSGTDDLPALKYHIIK